MLKHLAFVLLVGSALSTSAHATETVRLSSLDLSKVRQGWGEPQADRSIMKKPLSIAGRSFSHGLGTHSTSRLWVDLHGSAESFQAMVGIDDSTNGPGTVNFQIFGDGVKLYESGILRTGSPPQAVNVRLAGIQTLLLKVDDAGDGTQFDHGVWAEGQFTVSGQRPVAINLPREEAVILTPKPGPEPRLHAARVYGCRPGSPFLYRIPATGQRPMTFAAENLPQGLQLDASNGIISGTAPERGEHKLLLRASNSVSSDTRSFTIVSGDKLSLTPYMGWNHWYAHYDRITDKMVREAAEKMLSSGMADVGYSYVCIDDCWMRKPDEPAGELGGPARDEKGNYLPNARFPDMKGLTDFIHARGLKAGIYTSPGPMTCTSFVGSWQHEAKDARQFADWGFDLLKYDWCFYSKIAPHPTLEEMKRPYALMGPLVAEQKRDMIYNLCQYGMGNVWEWGADVQGHSWRTSGDLGFELDRIFEVAQKNGSYRAWNRPGAWNDPDYIQIGWIGNAHKLAEAEPCNLTPNEQYAFMSMWSLMACPLVFSGDMNRLDEFTLNVLCNPEVIEINQDPLGQCAAVSPLRDGAFLMVKEMEDGSKAVGLCNGGEVEAELTAPWSVLGLQGPQRVRDVWRHKDLGTYSDSYSAKVPRHAVVLLRFWGEGKRPTP